MKLTAGGFLILLAALLCSAYWLSQVLHNETAVGSLKAMCLLAGTNVLALFGGAFVVIGLAGDRSRA